MRNNIGTLDKTLRILLAIAFTVSFLNGQVSGISSIIGFIVSGQLVITSFIGYSPIYGLFGINTCRKRQTNRAFRSWN